MFDPMQHFQHLQMMSAASGYPNTSFYAPQQPPYGPSPYSNVRKMPYERMQQLMRYRKRPRVHPLHPGGIPDQYNIPQSRRPPQNNMPIGPMWYGQPAAPPQYPSRPLW